jgi:hypothetical protein
MVDIQVLLSKITIIFMIVLSGNRAVFGPQKIFARITVLLMASAIFSFECSVHQGDSLSWIGEIFVFLGMTVGTLMIIVEIHWIVNRWLKTFKR